MVRALTISILLAATFVSGCSGAKSAEEEVMDERVAILKKMPHRFTAPTDSLGAIRDRFRLYARCWGDYPIARDDDDVVEMEWPKDSLAMGTAYRISIVNNGATSRVLVEASDSHGYDVERLALYLRDAIPPIASWYEPCPAISTPTPSGT